MSAVPTSGTGLPTGSVLRRGIHMIVTQLRMRPRPFALGILAASGYATFTVVQSWALGRAVDRVVIPSFEHRSPSRGTVVGAFLLLIGVGVVKGACIVTRRVSVTVGRSAVGVQLTQSVLDQYRRLPVTWHRRHPTGELLARAETDVVTAVDILNLLPYSLGVSLLMVLTALGLFLTDPVMGLIAVPVFPLVVGLSSDLNRRVEKRTAEAQRRAGTVATVAHESFEGAAVVKALGAEERETARFAVEAEALRDARISAARTRAGYDAVLDGIPGAGMVLLVVVGLARIDAGALSPGSLVTFVNLFALLALPLRMIAFVVEDLPRALSGWDRVRAVLAEPVPPPPESTVPLPDGPLDLVVDRARFAYDEGGPLALDEVSLTVPAGSTLALVGPTGSGKSTLLLVLARLLAPDTGRVRLGGVDLAVVGDGELAGAVATAFQEPFLFGRSVRGNIGLGLGLEGEVEGLEAAAHLAQAHDFIQRLPYGYDTIVGERGATLSGGQRQRVALARAVVRRPRLLLLDDATSSVDPDTEARILAGLADRLGGTTTVLVATRAATIALADHVAYLERGRVLAVGRHDDLVASQPGYRALVEAYG